MEEKLKELLNHYQRELANAERFSELWLHYLQEVSYLRGRLDQLTIYKT